MGMFAKISTSIRIPQVSHNYFTKRSLEAQNSSLKPYRNVNIQILLGIRISKINFWNSAVVFKYSTRMIYYKQLKDGTIRAVILWTQTRSWEASKPYDSLIIMWYSIWIKTRLHANTTFYWSVWILCRWRSSIIVKKTG